MPKPVKPLTRHCRLAGGRLYWSDGTEGHERTQRKLLAAAMKHLPDGAYVWRLEAVEPRRRVRQNNAYWLALTRAEELSRQNAADDNWWTKDEWHVYFAQKYNGKVLSDIDPATGEVTEVRVGLSTTKLSVEEFAVYLDRVLYEIAERYGEIIEFESAA